MAYPTNRNEFRNFAGKFVDLESPLIPEDKIALIGVDFTQGDKPTTVNAKCQLCAGNIKISQKDIDELGEDKIWSICPNCYFTRFVLQ